jgi:hypothetical protein
MMGFIVALHSSVIWAETGVYHLNRRFEPCLGVAGAPTVYSVITAISNLTEIVQAKTNVIFDTNNTCAVEYESVALGYDGSEAAWAAVLDDYESDWVTHSNKLYDNVGWVKGVGPVDDTWAGYLWLLQNHAAFRTSPTNFWVSPAGKTNLIGNVLVGSIGDYGPMQDVVDVGPTNWGGDTPTNFLGSDASTDVSLHADFTAYYKLLDIRVDIDTDTDNNGIIDADDTGEDQSEEYAPGRILCVNGYGINTNTDYLAQLRLGIQPALTTGTARLEVLDGASRIRVWTTTNKTTEVLLPKTYDLATTNPPSVLYVDGIDTGKVVLAWSYASCGFTCADQLAMLIIPTISYAPGKGINAFVWAPLKTRFNRNSGNNLGWDDATEFETQIKEQGWPTVTWLEDTTGDTDTNFGSCTLANYKGMTNCGIFTVVSHGDIGRHPAVYAENSPAGLTAISTWCGGETGITIDLWDPDPFAPAWVAGCYVARVSSSWLSSNWKTAMDANRTISFWSICYSATSNAVSGVGAVKECAGGRWRVGYELPVGMLEAIDVNTNLIGRMNGSIGGGVLRTAGQAYSNGNYRAFRDYNPTNSTNGYTYANGSIRHEGSVRMDGNNWTTLCPSPLADKAVFPDVAVGNRKGWGCIVFDTRALPAIATPAV